MSVNQICINTIEGKSLIVDTNQFNASLPNSDIYQYISARFNLPYSDFFLEQKNHVLSFDAPLSDKQSTIYIKIRIIGGKGGFGSLLRGQAPTKKYTQNFDSCRDLSGRRLRTVHNEKKYKEWKQRKEEEEKIVEQEQREYESKKKELQAAIYANRYKLDDKYKKQLQKTSKSIADGVMKGIEKAIKNGNNNKGKRKMPEIGILDDLDLDEEKKDLNKENTEKRKKVEEEEKIISEPKIEKLLNSDKID